MVDTTTKQGTTPEITATEEGRNLKVVTPAGTFTIRPLPASKGGILLAQFVGLQVGQLSLDEDAQVNMFTQALGEELYTELIENYRLPEMTPVAQIALYWQTVGMEAVTSFLSGGPMEALKILLAQMGVSASMISPDLGSGSQTLSQAVTQNIATPGGGKNGSNKG